MQRIESTQRSAPNGIQVYILRTMRVRFPHIFESDWEFGFVGSPKFWAPNDAEGFCHHITLLKVMVDPSTPASTKVRAADSVMSHAAKAIEIEDIEARVSELERAAEAQRRR